MASIVDLTLNQVPPHSVDAEESVVGAILIDPSALDRIVTVVAAGDFYREAHKVIFGVALEMYDRKEPMDVVTLTTILRERAKLAAVGGATFVSELMHRVPTSANVESYARIVADLATRRRLIDAAMHNIRDAYESRADPIADLVARSESRIYEVGDDAQVVSPGTIDEAIAEAQHHITSPITRRIPTGYPYIDESIGGFNYQSQWVLAGRPGSFKSIMASDLAFSAAFNGVGVIVRSLENTRRQFLLRRVAKDLGIVNMRLQQGFTPQGRSLITDDERSAAIAKLQEYARLPIWILDDACGWEQDKRRFRSMKRQYPHIGQLVIDHVRLVKDVPGLREFQERERIGVVSGWGMNFCKEAKVNVILVSQLNRESEKENREPIMSDLALSGSLEQDAHGIMFAHMPDKESAGEHEEEFKVIIGKNRDGPRGRFAMRAVRKFCRVLDPLEEQRRESTPIYLDQDDESEVN